jgi:hypothetical protein
MLSRLTVKVNLRIKYMSHWYHRLVHLHNYIFRSFVIAMMKDHPSTNKKIVEENTVRRVHVAQVNCYT